ncbi:dihydroneopterin aldolase [Halocynthiibacter namhaensis]|uniref:dihydroneopterin aldolase n=1 Tax=Halocynthiibacter namhaensis TaxID=1290553 RepID=UPI0006921999|nr:dihydroneopterin aldolase [Halocynthiibacter namhaensis]
MSTEMNTVFEHPLMRAEALALDGVADRLSLRDYEVAVEVGAFQLERDVLQRLRFNVAVEIKSPGEAAGDDVDAILSYDKITEAIDYELAAERLNLLETLAERIAARILLEPQAKRVFLRIEKPDRGPFVLGLEIVREVGLVEVEAATGPVPQIILVPAGQSVDVLPEGPVVLVPEAAPQTGGDAVTDARITLLEAEKNAWRIAAGHDQMDVIATRTELDWALKNGRIPVWAPSRMLFDTPDAPISGSAQQQAQWLAEELGASDVRSV